MADRMIVVTLPADVWGRIVLRAQESDDWGLRTLIEQAVHAAVSSTQETKSDDEA